MPPRARWSIGLAAFAVFAVLALQVVLHGPLTVLDVRVSAWLAAHRTPGMTQAMLLASNVHQTVKLLAVALAVAGWRWWRGDRAGAQWLLVVPVAELLNVGLKHVFQRVRPTVAEPLVHLSTYSFPSGHAVASTVFYGALCALAWRHARSRTLRVLACAVGAMLVVLVAFSRVYLGAHYATDVVAGIAVGAVCLALALRPPGR
jgi:undecaprenyl-diphosphatase